MGLFDVIDDIAEKQVMKTDTGDNRIFGVVIGQIAKNYDKDMPGRVCVCVPVRDEDANELQWARVAMPSGGSGWGRMPTTSKRSFIAPSPPVCGPGP